MKLLILSLMLALSACATNHGVESSDNKPLRVLGTGSSIEEAKNNGFKTAIEIVVGSVVLSESKTVKDSLIRDEIVKHSTGYVDDYKIINESRVNNQYSLVMDVYVKSSSISKMLLTGSTGYKQINGDKLSTQYNTYKKSKENGDRFLNILLRSYPENSFTIKTKNVEFVTDINRNALVVVPFTVEWNYNFLNSLNEALQVNSDNRDTSINQFVIAVTSKSKNDWIGSTNRHFFNDHYTGIQVNNRLSGSISILFTINDIYDKPVAMQCYNVIDVNGKHIDGTKKMSDKITFNIFQNVNKIKKFDNISHKVMFTGDCVNAILKHK